LSSARWEVHLPNLIVLQSFYLAGFVSAKLAMSDGVY